MSTSGKTYVFHWSTSKMLNFFLRHRNS